jgi:hypothetical protein
MIRAPLFTPDELPAATVPLSRNGVGSFASASKMVPARGCSYPSTTTSWPLQLGIATDSISLSSRPLDLRHCSARLAVGGEDVS